MTSAANTENGMNQYAAAEGFQFAVVAVGATGTEADFKDMVDTIMALEIPEYRVECTSYYSCNCTCSLDLRQTSVEDFRSFDGAVVGRFAGACDGCVNTIWSFKTVASIISPASWYAGTPADEDRRLKYSAPFALLAGMCGADNRRVPHAALLELAKAVCDSMIVA